ASRRDRNGGAGSPAPFSAGSGPGGAETAGPLVCGGTATAVAVPQLGFKRLKRIGIDCLTCSRVIMPCSCDISRRNLPVRTQKRSGGRGRTRCPLGRRGDRIATSRRRLFCAVSCKRRFSRNADPLLVQNTNRLAKPEPTTKVSRPQGCHLRQAVVARLSVRTWLADAKPVTRVLFAVRLPFAVG
ncbi:MAG: hypothetical protein QOD93_4901, partial [Acetobacteraceae bacterium]|nr:hypothetical protein [Acetobacteraceae bacterium]